MHKDTYLEENFLNESLFGVSELRFSRASQRREIFPASV